MLVFPVRYGDHGVIAAVLFDFDPSVDVDLEESVDDVFNKLGSSSGIMMETPVLIESLCL